MSIDNRDGWIWQDGQFVPWRDATSHVLTHTLHYGMGVFEGIRAYETPKGPAIFRLSDHLKRLFNSAKIFMMEIPWDIDTIAEACREEVRKNNLTSCYLRPLIYYGSEAMGISTKQLSVRGIIAAWAWGAYLGDEGMEKGITVKTSSFTRHHVNVTMCRAKASASYCNSILANREASADGYNEALLLDVDGFVSEGPGENVFIVKNGKLFTPELSSCLEGITRETVIQLAKEAGIEVIEKRITRDEVYCADEAFFTGTAAEITPIRSLDRRIIGEGRRGPMTTQLQSTFFDVVTGKSEQHQQWLDYI